LEGKEHPICQIASGESGRIDKEELPAEGVEE
jgi:hypothetical protein